MRKLIILGTGMAAYSLAREFRKLDNETPMTLISADSGDFYSKPMLSNALAQSKTSETLVTTPAAKMAEQIGAEILSHCHVRCIDSETKTVAYSRDGAINQLSYTQLVIALGAEQRQLPLEGDKQEILSVNSLEDYAVFEKRLKDSAHVAIIGSGLIGCEFANDIITTGRKVTVVGASAFPLANLLPEQAGEFFQKKLQEQGIAWKNGLKVVSIEKHAKRLQLRMNDGSHLDADLVLSAIGLAPRVQLAQQAGIETNRGVVVDTLLQSSVPDVYALGDCAEINGLTLAYILPIMHSARALAKTLTGTPTAVSFPVMPVVVKTPAHAVVVSNLPAGSQGHWHIDIHANGVVALFRDELGKLLAYALTGSEVSRKQELNKEVPGVMPGP
ncbi:MAG: FAD-dependent oxidoreductase [Gammaproteobacteria bacterium]|nr:FAD-dependent oxidoreductase [Gammaproteobacteria bacterium]MDH5802425.1 FAD-dependent oxidoreductase [Gammaproteobacteria bacterium]